MKSIKHSFFVILILFYFQPLSAQTEDKSLLSVDRIFNSKDFMGEFAGQTRWTDNGKFYTTLENSKDTTGGKDIVKYETETEKKK